MIRTNSALCSGCAFEVRYSLVVRSLRFGIAWPFSMLVRWASLLKARKAARFDASFWYLDALETARPMPPYQIASLCVVGLTGHGMMSQPNVVSAFRLPCAHEPTPAMARCPLTNRS